MSLDGRKVIALVPARGGSKGVLGKNMRLVKGMPLVGYTLKSALASSCVDTVYLTSDDENTLAYGASLGVRLINRPEFCSSDTACANSVVEHFLSVIQSEIADEDPYLIYLQPTSPLRTEADIDDALEKMVAGSHDSLISVTQMDKSPFKAFVLNDAGCLAALFDEKSTNMRRQDLPIVYMPNGAIYAFLVSAFRKANSFPSNGSYPYIMDEQKSLDIDKEEDFDALNRAMDAMDDMQERKTEKMK